MRLKSSELLEINGGGISASLLNAVSRAFTTAINLGQIIGSAIRRIISKKAC